MTEVNCYQRKSHCVTGIDLNRRNHDERPIEPRDESARRPRTLEASPKHAGQGHVERCPLADQRPAGRTVWRGEEIKPEGARSYDPSVPEARNGGALYSQPRLD